MIPYSKDDIETFVPASLKSLPAPPTFQLRPATRGDKRAWNRALFEAGLQIHGTDSQRALIIRELERAWSEDVRDTEISRLRNLWASMDQGIDVDPAEIDQAAELEARLIQISLPLRRMMADNSQFYQDAPKLAVAMYLVGWRNIDLAFSRAGGQVELELIDDLEAALAEIEKAAVADKIEGVTIGAAFLELQNHAFNMLGLTKAEAGNSESLPPSSPTQTGSETTSPPAASGSSARGKTPRNTRKTPRT